MSRSKAQPRPRLPSLLPGWLGRLLAGAIVVAGFLLADTVYLLLVRFASGVGLTPFALGADTLPRFYQFMLLAHTGVGIALVGVCWLAIQYQDMCSWWRTCRLSGADTTLPPLGPEGRTPCWASRCS